MSIFIGSNGKFQRAPDGKIKVCCNGEKQPCGSASPCPHCTGLTGTIQVVLSDLQWITDCSYYDPGGWGGGWYGTHIVSHTLPSVITLTGGLPEWPPMFMSCIWAASNVGSVVRRKWIYDLTCATGTMEEWTEYFQAELKIYTDGSAAFKLYTALGRNVFYGYTSCALESSTNRTVPPFYPYDSGNQPFPFHSGSATFS